jgi:hypothetical protein
LASISSAVSFLSQDRARQHALDELVLLEHELLADALGTKCLEQRDERLR